MTALRRAAAEQDDSLREQAREVLGKALRGEEVPKTALDSARSLFSYRADTPPHDPREAASEPVRRADGRPVYDLGDLIDLVVELEETTPNGTGLLQSLGPSIERAHAKLIELKQRDTPAVSGA